MRRELVIAGAILIPFVVLVSLSLRGRTPPAGELTERPAPPFTPGAAIIPSPAARDVDAGTTTEPEAPQATAVVLPREVLVAAQQCLEDQERERSVEVRFTPTREGRFSGVSASTQDPYLAACLEDVFEEARWTVSPAATEAFAPTTHVFKSKR